MPLDVHRTAQEKTECDVHLVHLHFFHLTKIICLNPPTYYVQSQFLQLSDLHKTNRGRKTIIKGRRNKKSSNSCPNRRL